MKPHIINYQKTIKYSTMEEARQQYAEAINELEIEFNANFPGIDLHPEYIKLAKMTIEDIFGIKELLKKLKENEKSEK